LEHILTSAVVRGKLSVSSSRK